MPELVVVPKDYTGPIPSGVIPVIAMVGPAGYGAIFGGTPASTGDTAPASIFGGTP